MIKPRGLLLISALLATTFVAIRPAEAIPAFARKYQLSCSTCHAPFPRLKPFGEEFAGRGFRMDDPSKEPSRATYDVGDPLLELPREFPLASRMEGYASWKEDAAAESDAEWPWAFKLLSGGPIGEKTSYYVYLILEKGESIVLEDAWVQFNEVAGLPLDIAVGQFQVCDPLFKRELRLERFDYEIFKTHVGLAVVDLTYDRGIVTNWHAPGEVDVVLQIVNGNGIDAADDLDNFDRDKYKNAALRAVRTFGPARVGLFGYLGKEKGDNGLTNRTTYFGPDLVVDLGEKLQLSAEYLERRDDDPFYVNVTGPKFKTRGGFLELHLFPQGKDGRWVLSWLYNRVTSDDAAARAETASLTVNYLLARNARIVLEGGRDLEDDASRLSVGLVTAF